MLVYKNRAEFISESDTISVQVVLFILAQPLTCTCVCVCVSSLAAGRTTTNEELEDMLESGKLAIFTDDVRARELNAICSYPYTHNKQPFKAAILILFATCTNYPRQGNMLVPCLLCLVIQTGYT